MEKGRMKMKWAELGVSGKSSYRFCNTKIALKKQVSRESSCTTGSRKDRSRKGGSDSTCELLKHHMQHLHLHLAGNRVECINTWRSLFCKAHGELPPKTKVWPLEPAPAPTRPVGSVGPVDPPTLGLSRQTENMMLSLGTFKEELLESRRLQHGDRLDTGHDLIVGKMGIVKPLETEPSRLTGLASQEEAS
eukprot:gene25968-11653_t